MVRDRRNKRSSTPTYEEIRAKCLREGRLFEDQDFPASDRSLFIKKQPSVPLIWKRPKEICRDPKFFSGVTDRHDVAQGTLQNCWFVSALASLSQYKSLLYQVCPENQSFDRGQYCGVFLFRFWRFGEWVEVYVDDRLPTYNGKLYFTKSNDPEEFWSALLEKAYCKMHGPYESLALGVQSEALQDFTGGVIEKINLSTKPSVNLFSMMIQAGERYSLMGVSITATPGKVDLKLKNGLIMGHAYSITGLKQAELTNIPGRPIVELIRIRNPWGNDAEWKGAWSDGSPEWLMLSTRQKQSMGLTFEDDGEFWMNMDDFVEQFSVLEICMLKPGSVKDDTKQNWEMRKETGRWQAGLSAGGCRNFIKYYHTNPQFRVKLEERDEEDNQHRCSMVVALMRKDRHRLQRDVPIGFAVYKVPDNMPLQSRLDKNYFDTNRSVAKTSVFTKEREITLRCLLPTGEYVIVPSTFEPNQEADFLLRIFSQEEHKTTEIDQKTELLGPARPKLANFDRTKFDTEYNRFFHRIAGEISCFRIWDNIGERPLTRLAVVHQRRIAKGRNAVINVADLGLLVLTGSSEDEVVDQYELQQILNHAFKLETSFSLEAARSMISMFDYNQNGVLEYEEFIELWMLLKLWQHHFQCYDRDNSGDMDMYELREALVGLKFSLSNRVLETIVLRFHNKKGAVTFDMFVQINVRLVIMFETFNKHSKSSRQKKATFNLDDFIVNTFCI